MKPTLIQFVLEGPAGERRLLTIARRPNVPKSKFEDLIRITLGYYKDLGWTHSPVHGMLLGYDQKTN